MNYIKIQTDILKSVAKEKGRCLCQKVDDYYLISINGCTLFRIPIDEMWLDYDKIIKKFGEGSILKHLDVKGEDGVLTDCVQEIETKTVVKIASKHYHTWVNKKFIGEFGIKKGLHFTVSNNKYQPVIVWENDILCGLIMPVRVKEDE